MGVERFSWPRFQLLTTELNFYIALRIEKICLWMFIVLVTVQNFSIAKDVFLLV
jgi:hypothetical protein